MNTNDILALSAIRKIKPPPSITQIADRIGVCKSAATGIVERLVQQEMVVRASPAKNRRSKFVTITVKGDDALKKWKKAL